MKLCCKDSFAVIGKMGSTEDGEGFIQRLWEDANAHFGEVSAFAKRDENGSLCGVWGAMSDFSGSFQPWEEGFSRGLYLAGVECGLDQDAPNGWTKWVIPAFEYFVLANGSSDSFAEGLMALEKHGLTFVGAVQEYTCPADGRSYLYYPVRKLD